MAFPPESHIKEDVRKRLELGFFLFFFKFHSFFFSPCNLSPSQTLKCDESLNIIESENVLCGENHIEQPNFSSTLSERNPIAQKSNTKTAQSKLIDDLLNGPNKSNDFQNGTAIHVSNVNSSKIPSKDGPGFHSRYALLPQSKENETQSIDESQSFEEQSCDSNANALKDSVEITDASIKVDTNPVEKENVEEQNSISVESSIVEPIQQSEHVNQIESTPVVQSDNNDEDEEKESNSEETMPHILEDQATQDDQTKSQNSEIVAQDLDQFSTSSHCNPAISVSSSSSTISAPVFDHITDKKNDHENDSVDVAFMIELEVLREEKVRFQQLITDLRHENTKLQEEYQKLNVEFESVEKRLIETEDKLDHINKQYKSDAQKKQEAMQKLEGKNAELCDQLQKYEQEKEDDELRMMALLKVKDTHIQEIQGEMNAYKKKLEDLQESRNREQEETGETIKRLEEENARLKNESYTGQSVQQYTVSQLKHELAELERALENEKRQSLEKMNESNRRQSELELKFQDATRAMVAAERIAEERGLDLQKFHASFNALESDLHVSRQEKQALEISLSLERQRVQQLEKELQEATAELSQTRIKVHDLEEANQSLTLELVNVQNGVETERKTERETEMEDTESGSTCPQKHDLRWKEMEARIQSMASALVQKQQLVDRLTSAKVFFLMFIYVLCDCL